MGFLLNSVARSVKLLNRNLVKHVSCPDQGISKKCVILSPLQCVQKDSFCENEQGGKTPKMTFSPIFVCFLCLALQETVFLEQLFFGVLTAFSTVWRNQKKTQVIMGNHRIGYTQIMNELYKQGIK